ncbi:MAG: nucleotidyltransferase [Acidobacteria bacterium]|jgi:glucose-1-phosphate thymidylyltransferase|nr:MAG: nucleotidyltransferase [Acidobacteriota bacterium]
MRRWGVIPAAGRGTRIQPLAFSKELLPVGTRLDHGNEHPRAVSEYLIERMLAAGADRLCFVISPQKTDIISYFAGNIGGASICYAVQQNPSGLCDAVFHAIPFISPQDEIMIGLPDTVWFPHDGFRSLPDEHFSFLLFSVDKPQYFDAVVTDEIGAVREIQVKSSKPDSHWVWGAFKMPGNIFSDLHSLWLLRGRQDEYIGTLVNAYIAQGGQALGVKAGESYVDVGTLHGYREALRILSANQVAYYDVER